MMRRVLREVGTNVQKESSAKTERSCLYARSRRNLAGRVRSGEGPESTPIEPILGTAQMTA